MKCSQCRNVRRLVDKVVAAVWLCHVCGAPQIMHEALVASREVRPPVVEWTADHRQESQRHGDDPEYSKLSVVQTSIQSTQRNTARPVPVPWRLSFLRSSSSSSSGHA